MDILSIENEQISRHGSEDAVGLFRDLLWAESHRLGISPEIRVSERITTPDGGIDASANNMETGVSELIRTGYSGYQIKTGTKFALTESELKKELFGQGNEIKKENLGDSVQRCLDVNGHLTFVCFGIDPVESQVNTARDLVNGWLETCGYRNVSVRFWGQTTIKSFLGDFPSLRLKVNGRGGTSWFEIFDSWKSHGDMTPEVLSLGDAQNRIIKEMRTQLLTNMEALHLRITGESGIGKTRLVLEVLDDEQLRPLVIYTDNPAQLESQGFLSHVAMPDNHLEIVLVLDECSTITAMRFWNRLQTLGRRIRLITIYNEEDAERNGTTKRISLPPLDDKEVADILKEYEIPGEYIDRWARICQGSPRWAKIIGENLKNNSKDVLALPDNVPVVNRYIAGTDNPDSELVKGRKLILCFLALFKRVGYKAPVADEADAVYALIAKYDSSITRAQFDDSIRNLHDRRILQGEKTYYITPKPLQIKLWVEWWERYSGAAFNSTDFSALPPALVAGFNEMFRFAQESEAAMKTVEYLLGQEGPFADGKLLHEDKGGDFFLALTEASPEKALERLEATIGKQSHEDLLDFRTGRHDVIWALERIAVWEGLFTRAMRVLLRLSEAENDTVYSNNSTGVFKDFFSLFSPTEEAPQKRLALIEELLASKDPAKERLAIEAMKVAVDDYHTHAIGAEHQGLRRQPRLWDPRNHPKEAQEYINKIWDMLLECSSTVSKENRDSVTQILMHKLHVLGRTPQASAKGLETAKRILAKGDIDKNELIETVVHILHYGADELPEDALKMWNDFYEELVPADLSSQLNRYVAMNLAEDSFKNHKGEYAEEDKIKRIADLAGKAFENQDELSANLPWLVTDKAGNGHEFGYYLGKQDKEKALLEKILETRRKCPRKIRPNQFFLGGYLRALYEADSKVWEELLRRLAKEKEFVLFMPELVWRGGITDDAIKLLIELTENGAVDPALMAHFKYGTEIRNLGEDTFRRLIKSLLSHKNKATVSVAIDIFARYYADKEAKYEMPKELTAELLTNPAFFVESKDRSDIMDEYTWSKVAGKFLDQFSADKDAVLKIGLLMLDSIGNDGSIVDRTDREIKAILSRISEICPEEMWLHALTLLEKKGYFIFKHWLSSNEFFSGDDSVNSSLLKKIKLETLWAWIDENVEKRAWFIANLAPKMFSNESGDVCLAREILIRYGDRGDVRRNLHANFFSEGWSGHASDHHKKQLDHFESLRKKEADPRVIRWLDEHIDRRKTSIENAKTDEERGDF